MSQVVLPSLKLTEIERLEKNSSIILSTKFSKAVIEGGV